LGVDAVGFAVRGCSVAQFVRDCGAPSLLRAAPQSPFSVARAAALAGSSSPTAAGGTKLSDVVDSSTGGGVVLL